LRPQHTVHGDVYAHIAQKLLQYLDRIGPRVDIHVKYRCLQRGWQGTDPGPVKIMLDENIDRLIPAQRFDIRRTDLSVARQIQPQTAHGMDRDAKLRGPTGIIGIIHISPLAGDDLFRNLSDSLHGLYPLP
jgi:hypothetical protein